MLCESICGLPWRPASGIEVCKLIRNYTVRVNRNTKVR